MGWNKPDQRAISGALFAGWCACGRPRLRRTLNCSATAYVEYCQCSVEDGKLLIGNAAGQYVPIDKSTVGIQDLNGSLVLQAVTLWGRMTDDEAEPAMATQPFRTRQIFTTANTFRSSQELWPLLVQVATGLFEEERAAEALSPACPIPKN